MNSSNKMNNSDNIIETIDGTIKIVRYNKPSKKNAIDYDMYIRITDILNEAQNNVDINVVVLTGTGDFYSSGNDMVATMSSEPNFSIVKKFVDAFITFPKMLIAIVNGPAIGIASTTLPFCDLVFAAENAYFYTPFTKYGFVPEGCSSVMFPRILGDRKAIELLLFGFKLSATEALRYGFVNDIYKPEDYQKVWDRVVEVSNLPSENLMASKRVMRVNMMDELLKINEHEVSELDRIWKAKSKI